MEFDIYNDKERAELEQRVATLEKVSGYSLEVLTRMFAAGFEMTLAPDYLERSEGLMRLFKEIPKGSSTDRLYLYLKGNENG